eukprot:jgi/Bigna1/130369/aug1.11_g5077
MMGPLVAFILASVCSASGHLSHFGREPGYNGVTLQEEGNPVYLYFSLRFATGPLSIDSRAGSTAQVRTTFILADGQFYMFIIPVLPFPGETSTEILLVETFPMQPAPPAVVLNTTFEILDPGMDWLLSEELTLYLIESPGNTIPNFDCGMALGDFQSCNCSFGLGGPICNTTFTFGDALLQPDGKTLTVNFSISPFISGILECERWVEPDTLIQMGSAPNCSAISPNQFQVKMSPDATILIGAEISMFPAMFLPSRLDSIVQELQAPDPVPIPEVILTADTIIPVCGSIQVTAVGVSGDACRELDFIWFLAESGSIHVDSLLISASEINSQMITIPNEQLPFFSGGSRTFEIVLVSTNWLGGNATTSILITQEDTLLPPILELTPLAKTVEFDAPVTIRSTIIEFLVCDGYSASFTYLWEQISGPTTLTILNNDARDLFLPEGPRKPGEYCFNVTLITSVVAPDETTSVLRSVATSCIILLRPQVRAVIEPGNVLEVFGGPDAEGNVVFNASNSIDPLAILGSDLQRSFSWSVSRCLEDEASLILDSAVLSIPASLLIVDTVCVITVIFSAPSSSDSDSVTFLVKNDPRLLVSIEVLSPFVETESGIFRVSSSEPLQLRANILDTSSSDLVYSWSGGGCIEGVGVSVVCNSEVLTVDPSYLIAGEPSSFLVKVETAGEIGIASLEVFANTPPILGSCVVDPLEGIVFTTPVFINCSGFTNPEGRDSALTYTFSISYRGVLNLLEESCIPSLILPTIPTSENGPVIVSVTVTDELGDTSLFDVGVTVSSSIPGIDIDNPSEVASRLNDEIEGGFNIAVDALAFSDAAVIVMAVDSMLPRAQESSRFGIRESLLQGLERLTASTDLGAVSSTRALTLVQVEMNILNEVDEISANLTEEATEFLDQLTTDLVTVQSTSSNNVFSMALTNSALFSLGNLHGAFSLLSPEINGGNIQAALETPPQRREFALTLLNSSNTILFRLARGVLAGVSRGTVLSFSQNNITLVVEAIPLEIDSLTSRADGFSFRVSSESFQSNSMVDSVLSVFHNNILATFNANLTDGGDNPVDRFTGSSLVNYDLFVGPSNPADINPLTVSGLVDPIEISIPLFPSLVPLTPPITPQLLTRSATCNFFSPNEGVWSENGCTFSSLIDQELTCSCDHLTTFVARIADNMDLLDIDPLSVGFVAAANIVEFPFISLILAGLYIIFIAGLPFAHYRDRDLFKNQIRRALKFSKKVKRREEGMQMLKKMPLLIGTNLKPVDGYDSSDADDEDLAADTKYQRRLISNSDMGGDNFNPRVKSNTAIIRLLKKLRDDCTPFAIHTLPSLKPKKAREQQYLQRVRRY